jgi:hypothetical protein
MFTVFIVEPRSVEFEMTVLAVSILLASVDTPMFTVFTVEPRSVDWMTAVAVTKELPCAVEKVRVDATSVDALMLEPRSVE